MQRTILIAAIIAFGTLSVLAASIRPFSAGGGGDSGGGAPPIGSTTGGAPVAPSLGPSNGNAVVRIYSLSAPVRRAATHTRVVIREGGLPIDVLVVPLDAPFVLTIPSGPDITFDVWGSDAIDLPIGIGQVVRIVLP